MESENSFEKYQIEKATKRVQKIKRFYTHLVIYVIAISLYVAKFYFSISINLWPINVISNKLLRIAMGIWTLVMLIDVIEFFFLERFFGSKWEQEKVKKIMDEEQNSNKQKWI